MIVIENRQMLIPRGEEKIGTTADNLCDTRTFSIPRVSATLLDLSALDFFIDLEYADGTKDTDSLQATYGEERILLTWQIRNTQLAFDWIVCGLCYGKIFYLNMDTLTWS